MELHARCVNTIKGLAMDAVEAACSGHPGMPMGMADVATVLWRHVLVHDPSDPSWPDRDRFVLSPGHGSMLLYSLLHLSGYDLSLDDLRHFRQMGSKTPGHPEFGHTPGVETTTGPLGQGFAMGVGMAIAERIQRAHFGPELCDHYTYGIVSDGDLMEGVASEAASLAGHLRLGRLIYLYDANAITIDGGTDLAYTEDVPKRFEAYGWHVLEIDGHDAAAIAEAIHASRAETERPSLVVCRTVIGRGSRKEGTSATHGAPLGAEDVAETKRKLGMDPEATFVVPEVVREAFRQHEGAARHAAWRARLARHPRKAEFEAWLARDGAKVVAEADWPTFELGSKLATRKANQACMRAVSAIAPWFVGGSADLTGSNGTNLGTESLSPETFDNAPMFHFGVREHAMAAICNGMSLHGAHRPFCATFLVFHDYMRPAVRLSSLMHQPVVYVYSHDSIFLGEDGPTHQPIETLLALRAIPDMQVLRPADAHETVAAWKIAMTVHDHPVAIVTTRQGLPVLEETLACEEGVRRGGYVLKDAEGDADVVLLATGSEVSLALAARRELATHRIDARVVSVPCVERFLAQDADHRASILPRNVPRVSIEAGTTLGWERLVGDGGLTIGIDHFGASAPAADLAEAFGFTPTAVADRVRALLATR